MEMANIPVLSIISLLVQIGNKYEAAKNDICMLILRE